VTQDAVSAVNWTNGDEHARGPTRRHFCDPRGKLVAGYDVVDLLDTLVNASAELLDAAAAGLILADEAGELSVIASTSERGRLVEIMQLRYGLGPGV